jgi:hypothetical protein
VRRVGIWFVIFGLTFGSLAIGGQKSKTKPANPPTSSDSAGFGPALCEGSLCDPAGGGIPIQPKAVSVQQSFFGFPAGDRVSTATLGTGGFSATSTLSVDKYPNPYPTNLILEADLPTYEGQPSDEVIEASFSATPYIVLLGGSGGVGTIGIGLASDCRVLQNTNRDDPWNPTQSNWDNAQRCSGITYNAQTGTSVRPWFFSVYKNAEGVSQTYAVSFHGYARSTGDELGVPFDAKVRFYLAGVALANTDLTQSYARVTSPTLMVNY